MLLFNFVSATQPGSNHRPPFFIGHNITFDLKFIWQRCVILGICPNFSLPFTGRHASHFHCTMQAWAGYGGRISQDRLCKALGMPGKADGIDGSKVWDCVKSGDTASVLAYNVNDVETVFELYRRQTFKGLSTDDDGIEL